MKRYMILTKNSILIASAIALGLVFVILIFTTANPLAAASAGQRKLPIYSVQKQEKVVSLSFDAAWGADDTQQLIDIFNKYQIKVTFFVVGGWVDKFPDKVKALHDAGHEIQNHSDSHPHLTNLSRSDIEKELTACNQKIAAITGVTPTLMRPPYGDYNNQVIEVTESIGMKTIQWSADSLDWKDLDANQITDRVLSAAEPGGIVLFHNAAKHTPEALPIIIEQLQKDGYSFVPISHLIYQENYTIDHNGMQIPNAA